MSDIQALIDKLESHGYQWDVGYTGSLREARVWKWPDVVGRYRATTKESAYDMLSKAAKEVIDAHPLNAT